MVSETVVFSWVSKAVGWFRDWFVDEKNRKEKRIADVVELYLKNEANRVVNGNTGLVRAGASLLQNEDELREVIHRITQRGSRNPIGEDYEKLKEKNLLLMFIQEASKYTNRTGLISKSSEEIIKILEEKSNR